ncbi:MAG: Maf family protein [Deltaproteobacteria bacterium]|nr:Maf family protein [Deltaproteobacteria bacterium]
MTRVKLVLASASPRRRELLMQVGLEFDVVPSNVPEEPIHGETPEEHVIRLSVDKAREVGRRCSHGEECWIIGSDTIVLSDGKVFGKPEDDREAARMLSMLSGRKHRVITGYCILNSLTGAEIKRSVETVVFFKKLRPREIVGYVESGEPMDKAGGYAIQGIGSFMVERIEGSYSNVVGLPVCQIVNDLEMAGAVSLFSK